VAQNALCKVGLAMVRVEDHALFILGHGIDGQVAADQVFLQRNVRAGVKGEPAVTASALALCACEGIFLAGLWMQEHREISADRAEAQGMHLLDRGANHQPVDITDREPEQAVAYCAADFVDVHVQPPLLPTG